ncbi:metal ABC transporter ATP-binding protein [Marmoricola sp. RAF53]|uniref:metal ABC transporter ATP-binding protein n=1 Tax=Marmoricola sp. RAF53 TaxID=3233059 RepID=UPI003F99F57C
MNRAVPVLEVTSGAVALGGRPILRDIDLRVEPGEVVALLGANGSGKSTLVKAAVGLLPLSAGSVALFGEPLSSFRAWQRLGYVPQRSPMNQGIPSTVREVVSSGRLAHRKPFAPARAADRAAVDAALAAVGLTDRATHPVATLSGGQQQRVLMARTLAGGPELLVLDEPLAGVDLISQQAMATALAERARAGATVVVVLHELGPFESLIGRTVVLREGRIVYDGAPAALADLAHDHDVHCAPTDPVPRLPLPGPLGTEGRR